jgi:hypothetical protein
MWLDGQLDDYMKQEVNNCENGGVKFFHILLQKLSLIVCLSYCITLNRKKKTR